MPEHRSHVVESLRDAWKPPPALTVSAWADEYRRLSAEASSEPGRWRTARAEYQREMMDAACDRDTETVVICTSAQVGKSEVLFNTVGYYIHQNPAPMLMLQPTIEMAEAISKDRIAPMIRDTPVLTERIADPKARATGNTLLHKTFPGGHLTLAGANSPASLASRPVRVVLCDEVDRYPTSAGSEGDPVNLAKKRSTTFWNRKLILTSTPTIKDASRIELAYIQSDRRRYHVPCPSCGELHILSWSQVKWEPEQPDDAWHECPHCQHPMTHAQKLTAITQGKWIAERPFRGTAGFHINELYSPWRKFGDVASDFLASKDSPELLRVWVNTSLGETWEDAAGEQLDWEVLQSRALDTYEPLSVPGPGLFLTAGVDVQADRLAVLVTAWGRGEQCYVVLWQEIYGDPTLPEVWDDLDAILTATYHRQGGAELQVKAAFIDSGYKPQEVYQFCRPRSRRKIFPSKGVGTANKPILSTPTYQEVNVHGKRLKKGVRMWSVGTNAAKTLLYARLRIQGEGPGAIYTPQGLDESFYQQITAEKLVTSYRKGFANREWVKVAARNEALDCWVYAYAAAIMAGMARADWAKLEAALEQPAKKRKKREPQENFVLG